MYLSEKIFQMPRRCSVSAPTALQKLTLMFTTTLSSVLYVSCTSSAFAVQHRIPTCLLCNRSADYVSDQMRLETSFIHEASNARTCSALLAATPELRDKVYVPKVYDDVVGSERVMVMEYVDGCRWVGWIGRLVRKSILMRYAGLLG
jgi:hypothetical protein